jgi:hypothetical protein
MSEFYFTFGQRYATELHPQGGHPDGWFTVEAETEDAARIKMQERCGKKWATSYSEKPDLKTFPRGELDRF